MLEKQFNRNSIKISFLSIFLWKVCKNNFSWNIQHFWRVVMFFVFLLKKFFPKNFSSWFSSELKIFLLKSSLPNKMKKYWKTFLQWDLNTTNGKKDRNWDQENKSLQITQKKILIKLITPLKIPKSQDSSWTWNACWFQLLFLRFNGKSLAR